MVEILNELDCVDTRIWYLIFTILLVIVIRNVGDWFIFNIKSAPKKATVSKIEWFIGWVSLVLLIFIYLNYL